MTSPVGNSRKLPVSGFSLVELLVVAAIMGLLAGVAAISLRSLRSPALASAANEVASAIKMTRQMSIASGRKNYIVFPIVSNPLTTNLFRAYAVFEEVPPGEATTRPDGTGNYPVNNSTGSWFIPRTDWRTLPEGVVFCNLSTATYNTINLDPFTGCSNGVLFRPLARAGTSGQEWKFFESFATVDVRKEDSPTTNSLARLQDVPFLAFFPGGRAFYGNPGSTRQGAGLRLVQGFVKGDQIAVTDTNNFYTVETDPFVGRVRVRNRESYR